MEDDDLEASEEGRHGGHDGRQGYRPTAQEMQAHSRTHVPYRNWCRHCVAARGPNKPHRRVERDGEAPRNEVHADYCFLRDLKGGRPRSPLLAGTGGRASTSPMLFPTRGRASSG